MAKNKPGGPKIAALMSKPRLTTLQKNDLFTHILRRPAIFELAMGRMQAGTLHKHEDDRYRVLVAALHRLAKKSGPEPGTKKFKRRLRDAVRQIAVEQEHDELLAEAAEDVAGEGGLIDEAFEADAGELSDELGRSLLKRYLTEALVVLPLEALISDNHHDNQLPDITAELLENFTRQVRSLEGIDARAVKTIGEEWDEHEARLAHYRGKTMIGLKTGQPEFDRRTRGVRGLFLFGAKPGAGKTTYAGIELAVGVCRHHADNDCVVIVLCLDMDRFELYRRIECNLGGIEWVNLMFGSPEQDREPGSMFSKPHNACLGRAKKRLGDWQIGKRLAVPDRTVLGDGITLHRLTSIIEDHKAKAGAKRALLIIDYLQLLPVPEEVTAAGDLAADKYRIRLVQQVVENSRTKDDPLGDTALVISEARKPASSKDKDKEHWGDSMSDLMGSARLGYAADAVLLYREMSVKEMDTYYGVKDAKAAGKKREALREQGVAPVTLILEKGRDGMIRGKWGAEFCFDKSTFRELIPDQHLMMSVPPPGIPAGDPKSVVPGNGDGSTAGGHLPLPPPGAGKKPAKKVDKKSK